MNRSFQSVVIAFFASILLISGCSSGSSTGVSFSKLKFVTDDQCFSEYVSFYGDVQDEFITLYRSELGPSFPRTYDYDDWKEPDGRSPNESKNIALLIALGPILTITNELPLAGFDKDHYHRSVFASAASDFGRDHYRRTGAIEGRRLPYGCERLLRPDPRCFREYYFAQQLGTVMPGGTQFPQLPTNEISDMKDIHSVNMTLPSDDTLAAVGYKHWMNHGREEGRAVPTIPGVSCQGMITHQPACRPGSRFPNCNSTQDAGLGDDNLLTTSAAPLAVAAAEEEGPETTCVMGSVLINGVPNGEEC